MQKINKIEVENATPDYPLLLCRFLDPGSFTSSVVRLQSKSLLGKQTIERALDRNTTHSDVMIIIVDSGSLPSYAKLFSLIFRNRTVRLIGNALQSRGFHVNGSYAMYPSAKKISFAYERGSAAGRYAESMLLPTPRSSTARLINKALSMTTLGASSIELIAVVGRRT